MMRITINFLQSKVNLNFINHHSLEHTKSIKTKEISFLHIKAIEKWIRSTLDDAAYLDIPSCILKTENLDPLQFYKIDRLTLGRNGLEASSINRLYKSLFVYSTGFNELIREILTHSDNAYSSVTNIWRVFSILLEYSCKSDYEMIIGSIDKTIRDEIEDFQYKNNAKSDGRCRIHPYNLEIQENNQELQK